MNREGTRNSQAFFDDYLRSLRGQFFPDAPKKFAQQKSFLIQALAYPLQFLNDRGVWLPEKRIRQILNEVLTGIKQHGSTSEIRFFGGYFLDCVQKHMKFKDEILTLVAYLKKQLQRSNTFIIVWSTRENKWDVVG